MDKSGRYRKQWRFFLDYKKREDQTIAGELGKLKQQRSFQPFIKQALRICLALRRKDVTPLVEAFPWIPHAFQSQPQPYYAPPQQYETEDHTPILIETVEAIAEPGTTMNNFLTAISAIDGFD